jgi:ribosomal protein S13
LRLTYVYGIGKHTAKDILREAKVDENTPAGKLTEDRAESRRLSSAVTLSADSFAGR